MIQRNRSSRNFSQIGLTVLLLLGPVLLAGCSLADSFPVPAEADLVLINGTIVTPGGNPPFPTAVAVAGDTIAAVGNRESVESLMGSATRVIDLDGRIVLPGFIESHAHLLGIGLAMMRLDLTGTTSEDEIADLVRERAAGADQGQWIVGRGWDQNDWPDTAFPTSRSLTAAAPGNPVCLTRVDGHAVWVNKMAFDLAGITAATPDPAGGRIERDEKGSPSGVLVDTAMGLVQALIPPPGRDEKKQAIVLAARSCNALGQTSFHDAGAGRDVIELYRELLAEGQLTLRLNVMLDADENGLLDDYFSRGPVVGEGNHFLTIRSVKLFADGALGSRGAALLDDYSDEPGNRGIVIDDEDRIRRISRWALRSGFQVCTHAIGDRANRLVLDAYQQAFESFGEKQDHRFRIEHAQILDRADIPRFKELGVIASMQTQHCTSDMPWVPDRIGENRAEEGAYVWQSLLALGTCLPNGSDAPVESADPLLGFYAAVTRQDRTGKPEGGWYPQQRMTRRQALDSFTRYGAYASFEEEIKGSIEKGKLADLVVLSRDIMNIPEPEILETRVLMTVVGGGIVFYHTDMKLGD